MENTEVVSYTVAFLAIWKCYSFMWAILILFTIWLVIFTARTYSNPNFSTKISSRVYRNQHIQSDDNLPQTSDLDSTRTKRTIRTISRRYCNADSTNHDLPFTDLLTRKNLSPRRGTNLRSPEPLISQVTRHLSFSNDSYYSDRTRTKEKMHQYKSALNTTRLNNSYLLSPVKSQDTSLGNASPYQNPYLNVSSSPLQERYSPRCFSVINPTFNMADCPSTVKISQPSDAVDGFPLSCESVLQKRLQRTKENPCSRHAVLSALVQKSRKRPAIETDGSFLESTYSVKKRRRDELDDFLDSIADPQSSPAKVSSSTVKSVKRPYLHSDNNEESFSSTRADKRSRQEWTSPEDSSFASTVKQIQPDEEIRNTINKFTSSAGEITEDSGVVLSVSDDISTDPVKPKKGKSVTFSQEAGCKSSDLRGQKANNPAYSKVNEKTEQPNEGEVAMLEKEKSKFLPIFQARFSPRKPLHRSPGGQAKEKTRRLRSSLTWKDLQENRREAWRRSQKLLDDIEESFAMERGEPSGLQAVSSSAGLTLPTISGFSKTAVNSIKDNLKKTEAETSNVLGSMHPQSLPVTSLPLTTSRQQTQYKNVTGKFVNFIGSVSKSESSTQGARIITTATTKTVQPTQNLGITVSTNSSGSSISNSNTILDNNPSGISHGVLLSATSSTTTVAGATSRTIGVTSDFKFAAPSNPINTTKDTAISLKAATGSNKPLVATSIASSSTSHFPSFGLTSTSSTAAHQAATNTATFSLNAASTNFAAVVTPQTTAKQQTFNFLGHTGSTPSTTISRSTSQSTFSFQAPSSTNLSTNLPQTSTNVSTFSFQAPSIEKTSQPPAQPSLPSSHNKPTGVFNFNASSGTSSIFGGAGVQATSNPGFNFTSQNKPVLGNQGGHLTSMGSTNVGNTADQPKPAAGGFTFTAPTVHKPNTGGGFNFGQTVPGTFNFGSPSPAVGGFNFSGTAAGPGAPFLSSTPVPGNTVGMPNSTFVLGSSGRGGATAAKARPRRRRR